MDALSDLLADLRLRGTLYFRAELGPAFGIRFRERGRAPFYLVTRGACLLEIEGRAKPLALGPGDLVILPRGPAHALKSHAGAAVLEREVFLARHPADERGLVRASGGRPAATILDGGFFHVEDAHTHPLVEALPPVLHLRGGDARVAAWLEPTLRFIRVERERGQQGSATVLARLADILFVQAVRAHLAESASRRAGWLRGLADPQVGTALGLMHRHPEHPWTVQTLARQVGMSRTSFSFRFAALVGAPPLTYLRRWRIDRAAHLLRTERLGLAAVAERVGYGSEPALHRAFTRVMKVAPGRYRQRERALRERA